MFSTKNNLMIAETSKMKNKRGIGGLLMCFVLTFLVVGFLTSIICSVPALIQAGSDPALKESLVSAADAGNYEAITSAININSNDNILLMQFLTILEVLAAIFAVRVLDKRSYVSMGLRKGKFGSYLIGYVIGILLIVGAEAVSLATGNMTIKLSSDIDYRFIALAFLAYLIQGLAEEALCRGYLMMSLIDVFENSKLKVALGVVISSLVFAALHLGNPGITALAFVNLFLAGVLFALYVLRTDNLWGAAAIHSAWNFFQGHVLGTQVSGIAKLPAFFESTPIGSELFNGGAFGLEGGLGVTTVEIIAIALILFLPKKNAAKAETAVNAAE